jgi:membrane protease subunit HflK
MYIEAMQAVLSHSRKVIIDAKGATAPIILPPSAFQSAEPAAPAPAPPAAASATPPAPGAGQ